MYTLPKRVPKTVPIPSTVKYVSQNRADLGPADNILYCRGQEPKKWTVPRVSKFVAKKTARHLKCFIKGLEACRK